MRQLGKAMLPGLCFLLVFVVRAGRRPGVSWRRRAGWRFTLFDDAMISMTYGRTWARTGELVWYPGAPRTQGFTNPAWVALMAVEHVIGLHGSFAALTMSLVGVVTLIMTGVAVWMLTTVLAGPIAQTRRAALAAGAAVPALYSLSFWSLRGMEVGFLALASTVLLVTVPLGDQAPAAGWSSRRRWGVVVTTSCLGVLTRLDFALIVVCVCWCAWWWADSRAARQAAQRAMAVVVAFAAAIVIAQRWYYGAWLPNTYRLKLGGYSLTDRFVRGITNLGRGAPLLIVVAAAVWLLERPPRPHVARRRTRLAAACVATTCAYSVWVGGDAWEWSWIVNRYVSVALPAGLALAAAASSVLAEHGWPRLNVLGIAGGIAALAATVWVAGAATNQTPYGAAPARATAVAVAALLIASALAVRHPRALAIAVVVGAVAIGGTFPFQRWFATAGLHVRDDQAATEQGLALARATAPDAVVATVWAGAPAYYSERAMIDLLGKSDAHVAGVPARGELYPGHNRWDFEYSIRDARPDLVLGTWGPIPEFDATLEAWGYELVCFPLVDGTLTGVRIRSDSTSVDRGQFIVCPAGFVG